MINKTRLKELYLHWNHISTQGANLIYYSLIDNESLKVLDLSWNNINGDITVLT